MEAECAVLTLSFRSLFDLTSPALLEKQRHWRCVLSDSRSSGPVPPAKDVRALFDKANIGSMRYLTFASQKPTVSSEGNNTPAMVAESVVPVPVAQSNPAAGAGLRL